MQSWKSRNEGKELELMDPLLADSCRPEEFLRYLHLGLRCVQEIAYYRTTMSSVGLMLNSQTVSLREPQRPAFSGGRFTDCTETNVNRCSVNVVTNSTILAH